MNVSVKIPVAVLIGGMSLMKTARYMGPVSGLHVVSIVDAL